MAEVLIKAQEIEGFRADRIDPGWYRPGDPVVVMPDGHPWGREEGSPKFMVLKLPGISVEAIKDHLLAEEWSADGLVMILRRLRGLDKSKLPAAVLNELKFTGSGEFRGATAAQARDLLFVRKMS